MVIKRLTWPAELTLTLIGGKWKGLILHRLLEGESRRFGELKRLLPGISAKMLAKHLKELESDGLVIRLETGGLHPRILYTPTARTRSLAPILAAVRQWGEENLSAYGNGNGNDNGAESSATEEIIALPENPAERAWAPSLIRNAVPSEHSVAHPATRIA